MASTCPEFKVILCGEYGVGKTSLFRRFTTHQYVDTSKMNITQSKQSTLGLDHYSKRFTHDNKTIKIQLWDTGGLERVASITNSYYKFAEAALLVFSLSSLDSFHCLSQHLIEILSMAENAKIFLVGNKLDLEPHEVTDEIVDLFIEQFPKFDGYFKISCKHNIGIDEMFNEVSKCLASSNFSFKDTFDTFTLHGTHTHSGNCCSSDNPSDHSHAESSSSSISSCCANS